MNAGGGQTGRRLAAASRPEVGLPGFGLGAPIPGRPGIDRGEDERRLRGRSRLARAMTRSRYHVPVFSIEAHGSCGGLASPFCRISIEMPSGERTKAM